MKIVILEDEWSIRELVLYTLEHFGYEAYGFEYPSQFWEKLDEISPDLLILDIMLPEEDGLSILQKLRGSKNYKGLPIIMFTAKDQEYDKILGLDTGADDYIAKPVGMMELMARIRAVSRRSEAWRLKQSITFEDIQIYPEQHEVVVRDQPVELTNREYELLKYLIENKGIVISRSRLLDVVWGYSYEGSDRTVDTYIRSLRKKLGSAAECIKTVRGFGYKIS